MRKRHNQRKSRHTTAETTSGSASAAASQRAPEAGYDPYSEGLLDRIVAEWSEVVPGQDPAAREIAAAVYRIAMLLRIDTERVLARYRLSDTEFHLLGGLRRAGAPYCRSPSELSPRYVPVTSGGLSGVITRLARRGLVRRRDDPSDGRGVLVELTASGRQLIEEVMKAVAAREALLAGNLKPSERRQAARLLRSLLRAANTGFGAAPFG
jgi:DNA-binding MarR family transcriptional regulator